MRPRGSEKSFSFNAMPRPSLTGRFGERGGAAVCEVEDPVRAGLAERGGTTSIIPPRIALAAFHLLVRQMHVGGTGARYKYRTTASQHFP